MRTGVFRGAGETTRFLFRGQGRRASCCPAPGLWEVQTPGHSSPCPGVPCYRESFLSPGGRGSCVHLPAQLSISTHTSSLSVPPCSGPGTLKFPSNIKGKGG